MLLLAPQQSLLRGGILKATFQPRMSLLSTRSRLMPATTQPTSREDLVAEITRLKRNWNAVILSHNYQVPEVQDVADYVGDSLGLSQVAARTEADVIVFCWVHFMAETASIISPQKKVLLPDLGAGCSLAATIDADKLRAWKKEHPNAVVVSDGN